jgi:two-component system response regulator DevR
VLAASTTGAGVTQSTVDSRIRVLIVDDHEVVRAGLRALLASQSDIAVVGEAGTGSQAIAQTLRLRPHVVLLDARLPDMSGPEVCRVLCAKASDLAVAMLTTYTDDDLVRQCVRAGARGYMLKEISRVDLAQSVRSLAAGEAVIDSKVLSLVVSVARQGMLNGEPHQSISDRQRTILQLIADGLSNREIADHIHLSELTVKSYIEELLRQLGARNRVHAAILATRQGWLK